MSKLEQYLYFWMMVAITFMIFIITIKELSR